MAYRVQTLGSNSRIVKVDDVGNQDEAVRLASRITKRPQWEVHNFIIVNDLPCMVPTLNPKLEGSVVIHYLPFTDIPNPFAYFNAQRMLEGLEREERKEKDEGWRTEQEQERRLESTEYRDEVMGYSYTEPDLWEEDE